MKCWSGRVRAPFHELHARHSPVWVCLHLCFTLRFVSKEKTKRSFVETPVRADIRKTRMQLERDRRVSYVALIAATREELSDFPSVGKGRSSLQTIRRHRGELSSSKRRTPPKRMHDVTHVASEDWHKTFGVEKVFIFGFERAVPRATRSAISVLIFIHIDQSYISCLVGLEEKSPASPGLSPWHPKHAMTAE